MQRSNDEKVSRAKSGATSMLMLILSIGVFVSALMVVMALVRFLVGLAA